MASHKLQVTKAAEVSPNDTTNIQFGTRDTGGCVLYVGTGGNLRVLTSGGNDVTFANIADGTFLPVHVVRVFATSTTASNILALW